MTASRGVAIALSLVGARALGGCAGAPDDPAFGVARERLEESVWTVADVGDFNGDGLNDVLWDNTANSSMVVWLMHGTDVFLRGPPVPGPPGAAWSAAWASDFNADGLADVRWYNATTDESAIWLMTGTALLLAGPTLPQLDGPDWTRVTSADFNADAMADLLWGNKVTGDVAVWLMNGTAIVLAGQPVSAPLGDGWLAATSGDFNADGMADVLWVNLAGRSMAIGLMSATARLLQGPATPMPDGEGWTAASASDFDGDGKGDVLWYNTTTGRMTVWLMGGTELRLPGPEIPGPPGEGWMPATTGDVNGDGMVDVIWENRSTRRFAIWLMAGTQVLLAGPELVGPGGP